MAGAEDTTKSQRTYSPRKTSSAVRSGTLSLFRKNKISNALLRNGWTSYKDLAKPSRGRGASAGPIDTGGQYWSKRTLTDTKKWSTGYMIKDGTEIKGTFENGLREGYF